MALIGVYIMLELIGSLVFLIVRNPPNYLGDGINVFLKAGLLVIFCWMTNKNSLKARQAGLLSLMVELILQLILLVVTLFFVYFSDYCWNWCVAKADEEDWVLDRNGILYT